MKKISVIILILFCASAVSADEIDLLEKAQSIRWQNSEGEALPFGVDGKASGSVKYLDNAGLEDGKTYSRVLFIHPPWKSGGTVIGFYPDIQVPESGGILIFKAGFLKGAQGTDGTVLSIGFINISVPQGKEKARIRLGQQKLAGGQSLCSINMRYDGRLDQVECELEKIAGQRGNLVITLNAGRSADNDWAAITEAAIITGPADGKPGQKAAEVVHVLSGHTNRIYWIEFSPDGKYVATGSGDGSVRLWNATTGKNIRNFGNLGGHVFCASFSPNNKYLAAVTGKNARIWSIPGGSPVHTLKGHTAEVHSVRFSPDSQRIVTTSEDGSARVWRMDSGREIHMIQVVSSGWAYDAEFKPGTSRIAVAGHGGELGIWDVSSGKKVIDLQGHSRAVNMVRFNKGGNRLLSAGVDRSVRLWNANTGGLIRTFSGRYFDSADFSPDEKYVITGNDNGAAVIWNIEEGNAVLTLKHDSGGRIMSAALSPDGKKAATAEENGTAKIWKIRY